MKHLALPCGLASLLVLAAPASAQAPSPPASTDVAPMALDFVAVAGCPSGERFADEVSAKLGFVPWRADAAERLRIRIAADAGQLVGTIELPDGNSKVLRGADCAALVGSLATAVAVALDRAAGPPVPAAPAAPPPVAAPPAAPTRAAVHVRATKPGVRVSIVTEAFAVGSSSGHTAAGFSWRNVCTAPCSFEIEPGSQEIMISGEGHTPGFRELELQPGTDAYLVAKPGSSSTRMWGQLIGGTSTVAVIYGGLAYLIGDSGSTIKQSGLPLLIGGAVGIPVAIGLMRHSASAIDSEDRAAHGAPAASTGVSYGGIF